MSHSKKNYEKMLQDIIEEARRWDLLPKAAVWVATFRTWRSQILCTTTAPRARDTCSCCIGSTTGFLLALIAHINWATRGRGRCRLADISRWWPGEMEGALCKNSLDICPSAPCMVAPCIVASRTARNLFARMLYLAALRIFHVGDTSTKTDPQASRLDSRRSGH